MTRPRQLLYGGSVLVLAVLASGLGVRNGFTYDDRFVIEGNTALHLLRANWWRFFGSSYWPPSMGGDGYRPIALLLYSIQWVVGGGSAWVFHTVNIAVYGAVCLSVFWLGLQLLPERLAWLAAALFAVHPLHVEAVANIVGQAELWVALATVCAVRLYVARRAAARFSARDILVIAALYAFACGVKENGFVLPVLLAASELILVRDPRPLWSRFIELRPFALTLGLIAVGYLWARNVVLGRMGGFELYVPFDALHTTGVQRIVTMVGLVPQWVRLFLWPAHLSAEYGPPQYPIASGPEIGQVPGLILMVGILSLGAALRRRSPVACFGIAWMTLTLLPVSNLLVPTGVLIAERTLFLPSIGVVLALATAVPYLESKLTTPVIRVAALVAVQCLVLAGAVRSAARTTVWRDNDTLFAREVVDAPLVYRTHYMLGGWEFTKDQLRAGESEFLIAMKLFPADPFIPYNLAYEYKKRGLFAPAVVMYQRALDIAPDFRDATAGVAVCLASQGKFADARSPALRALGQGAGDAKVMRTIIEIAAAQRRAASAEAALDRQKGSPASGKVPGLVQKTAQRQVRRT
ncbi:MAG TPA: hypothetical protein VMH39_10500 [Gemmatimonadaceae bacterium]|nr:hypothetical protein [Gemmatimonadaceae bacterium]